MFNGILIVIVILMANSLNKYSQKGLIISLSIVISIGLFLNTVVRNELLNWSIL
jgi:hypothetical protein